MVRKLLRKAKTDLQVEKEKVNSALGRTITSCYKGFFPPSDMDRHHHLHHHPNLSLGSSLSSQSDSNNGCTYKYEENYARKRKMALLDEPSTQNSLDFHPNDPLPLDWEQCLDLQSGKMYYQNRKTLRKSWSRPRENQSLDLELNISILPNSEGSKKRSCVDTEKTKADSISSGSSMIAIVCFNCHQLVMLYCSCPSCPNCKYMHSLPALPPSPEKMEAVKSFETLSLLH